MYRIIIKDKTFNVDAASKKEALDAIADYLHTLDMRDYFKVAADFVSECDIGESVEEYAKSEGFYRYGAHNVYIPVTSVREVAR